MGVFFSVLLAACAGLVAIPVAIFFIEIVAAAVLPLRELRPPTQKIRRGRVAVLVPAHNESTGLLPTIEDIKKQLLPGDQLLVVADNCTDDTADVATAAGADVVERHDLSKHGKGYALDFGLRSLTASPPQTVIVIDADCRLANNTISRLTETCTTTARPAQALYLMTAPNTSQVNHQVAEFAWRVKNCLRPLGLTALHLPCQLMGTGMAFPWGVIRRADLATGWLVEDLKLGLDLASDGHAPVFCREANVTSQFAPSALGAGSQRRRWEHGHLNTILTLFPRFFFAALVRRNWDLLALTCDLAVPPLSFLGLLVLGSTTITGLATIVGASSVGLAISLASLSFFLLAVLLAWLKCGREVLPSRAILAVVPYVLRKLGLYCQFLLNKKDTRWNRTDRTR